MTTSMSGASGFRGPTGTGRNVIPKGYQHGQIGQYTPEQQNLFQHMLSQVGPNSFLSKLAGGDQGTFDQIEAPALRQFGALQGNIASRFSGVGSGARRSSGFQNALGGEATDFAERLQANRMGLQQQALRDMGMLSESLLNQRPFEQFLTEKQKPWWQQALMGLSPAFSQAAGTFGGLGLSKWAGLLPKQGG
jgi:hypothetical protein